MQKLSKLSDHELALVMFSQLKGRVDALMEIMTLEDVESAKGLEDRFGSVVERIDRLEGKVAWQMNQLDSQMDELGSKVGDLDAKMGRVGAQLEAVLEALTKLKPPGPP